MKRLHLIVSGVVQGVGFRWYTQRIATSLGLTGWVRNLQNGDVEIVVEGKSDIIEMFISELKNGYLGRNISRIKRIEEEYKGEFSDFRIKY